MTTEDARLADFLKAWPQHLLPGHLVTRLVYPLVRVRTPAVKDRLIRWFTEIYDVDLSEAEETDPTAYPDFNTFFTRALRPGARPMEEAEDAVACPVDGTVSQAGPIRADRLFQAKGHEYDLATLLGGCEERAAPFNGGSFATVYLSPRDYHRIHMPLGGRLTEMVHVPGRLYSVSPATTRVIPGLFARNERVVCLFETAAGPMALVLVGATIVGGIETVWAGPVTPPAARIVTRRRYPDDEAPRLERGGEMGRFNVGSTVIVLFGPEAVEWAPGLVPGATVRMGQTVGTAAPG